MSRGHHRVVSLALGGEAHGFQRAFGIAHAAGAEEGHDGVEVVEGVDAVLGFLLPYARQALEPVAGVDAFEMQPPQHGRSIEHFEHDVGVVLRADALVVKLERRLVVELVEMQQAEVPPVVVGEAAIGGPAIGRALEPAYAVLDIAAHFIDMGDSVGGPRVGGLGVDGFDAEGLGAGVVAAFLEAEGGHAKNGMPGVVAMPVCAHRLQRPVAQVELAAGEEAADMGVLQRRERRAGFPARHGRRSTCLR